MKKVFYLSLAALLCLSFQPGTKSSKTEPVPAQKDPYANMRIKQLNKNGKKHTEFFYDKANKLISFRDPDRSASYKYDESGKLISDIYSPPSNTAKKEGDKLIENEAKYSYNHGILTSYTLLPDQKVYYTYKEGQISQITHKDVYGLLIYWTSYKYSTLNGELKVIMKVVSLDPNVVNKTITEIYSAKLRDPDPLKLPGIPVVSPFVIKSSEDSKYPGYSYTIDYVTDADGKIISYTKTYPNKPEESATYTYIYEPKQ